MRVGFGDACSTALSSLRGARRDLWGQGAREEQARLFKKRKTSGAASWTQKFICLNSTSADRAPTTQSEKLMLEDAGLGEKTIVVPDLDCSQGTFHQVLLDAYPKLGDGGGYELLRCKPKSRELVLIGGRVASTPRLIYTSKYLSHSDKANTIASLS